MMKEKTAAAAAPTVGSTENDGAFMSFEVTTENNLEGGNTRDHAGAEDQEIMNFDDFFATTGGTFFFIFFYVFCFVFR